MTKNNIRLLSTVSIFVGIIVGVSSIQLADAAPFTSEQEELDTVLPILEEIYSLTQLPPLHLHDIRPSHDGSNAAYSTQGIKIVDDARLQELRAELIIISEEQRAIQYMNSTEKDQFKVAKDLIENSALPWSTVFVDEKDKILEITLKTIAIDDEEIKKSIKKLIDVPFDIFYGNAVYLGCATQSSDCNPIVGGLEMKGKGSCTIGLPVSTNTWGGIKKGFLTAAHCVNYWGNVYQPSSATESDGFVTKRVFSSDCDCAFVEKRGSSTHNSGTWQKIGTNSITSKSDPLVGDYVYMIGAKSGSTSGKIISVSASFVGNYDHKNVLQIHWLDAKKGDSGAPIIAAHTGGVFHGIVSARILNDTFAIKWTELDRALDLR